MDEDLNIIIPTDKPFKKSLLMVGTMPESLLGGKCKAVVKERSFPLTIEVCGLEKISRTATDQTIDFVIGKAPQEISIEGAEVKRVFENASRTCPIVKYQIVKTENGEEMAANDPIWDYVNFDKETAELKILNSASTSTIVEFYLQASTAGKVTAA